MEGKKANSNNDREDFERYITEIENIIKVSGDIVKEDENGIIQHKSRLYILNKLQARMDDSENIAKKKRRKLYNLMENGEIKK